MPKYSVTTRLYNNPVFPYGYYVAEPIPVLVMKNMLDTYWSVWDGSVPKPTVIIAPTGSSQPTGSNTMRYNLNIGDYLVLRVYPPGLSFEFVGYALEFLREKVVVEIEISTKASQQRVYDLFKEVRRIVMMHRKDYSTSYQLIRLQSFNELTQEQANVYEGVVRVSFENDGVFVARQYT